MKLNSKNFKEGYYLIETLCEDLNFPGDIDKAKKMKQVVYMERFNLNDEEVRVYHNLQFSFLPQTGGSFFYGGLHHINDSDNILSYKYSHYLTLSCHDEYYNKIIRKVD